MRHSYRLDCECPRCTKERARRSSQSLQDSRNNPAPAGYRWDAAKRTHVKIRKPRKSSRSPVPGSAEWAETRGDDIPSYDQPGDDFDMD